MPETQSLCFHAYPRFLNNLHTATDRFNNTEKKILNKDRNVASIRIKKKKHRTRSRAKKVKNTQSVALVPAAKNHAWHVQTPTDTKANTPASVQVPTTQQHKALRSEHKVEPSSESTIGAPNQADQSNAEPLLRPSEKNAELLKSIAANKAIKSPEGPAAGRWKSPLKRSHTVGPSSSRSPSSRA